ncbi:hypothetical protein [Nocardia vulneris]|uniref:Uncharacterized protein n=1 Tax=Nocardia vulneris TaxID=1141657 RepID=A0ABR4ZCQ2_9NOCA|nr:hypothetical protein [Nocardia vulneris]KIA63046.1 hypothetical protein FG87_22065 [Nocardia vulneris]
MAVHPDAYEQYVAQMLRTPIDSIEHHMADAVQAISDDDALLTLLVEMYLEDRGSRESQIAGYLLSKLFPKAVPS